MILVTSEQMQELDKRTISTLGVPGIVLMDHAGKALATRALSRGPERVVVLCGKGHNGGDGWVAARYLVHAGVPSVAVVSTVRPEMLDGDAKWAADSAVAWGVSYQVFQSGQPLAAADVYLDALLGTGANRPLVGALAQLVAALNDASGYVIAADVPTGVHASTGEVSGTAVRADETVCMAAQKLGTAVSPGCLYAGEVHVADIGIKLPAVLQSAWVTEADVADCLPKRLADSHKGTFGRVGVVVGEMTGAAQLAGLGAAKSGAGLVVLGTLQELLQNAPLEFVQRRAADAQAFADCQALVVGPGLGTQVDAGAVCWRGFDGPCVIDADGLRLLHAATRQTDTPKNRVVLTPHPKECAQLLGWTTAQVQARRLAAAQSAAAQTGCIVVLKGHHSVIAHPDGRIRINPTGDASLATAGTGDVLAGVIGGLMAQGSGAFEAAAAGAWLHGKAGELAGAAIGVHSVVATDVIDHLAGAIRLVVQTTPGGSLH